MDDMTPTQITMDAVRANERAHGRHFLTPSTMSFFNGRVGQYGCRVGDVVFFTHSTQHGKNPRMYYVARHNWLTGDTRNCPGEWRSLNGARAGMARIIEQYIARQAATGE